MQEYNNDRYSFTVEGFEQTPAQPVQAQLVSPAPAEQSVDRSYVNKMLKRVVALSVALALLLGGGLGILLNEFVFNRTEDSAAVSDDVAAQTDGASNTQNTEPDIIAKPDDTVTPSTNLIYTESSSTTGMSVADVVASTEDSVVAITVEIENTATYMYNSYSYTSQAKGSGVVISDDGYIITNNHVIADAIKVQVTLANGETYDAEVIGTDEFTDLGLIKIDASGLTVAKFGDSESLRKGDTGIIIGNPLGYLDGSVSTGVISAMGRTLSFSDGTTLHNLIQTDAAVNPGNSGGGLFDSYGALIGIVCAKTSSTEVEGLGFAIPVSTVGKVAQDLKDYGYVKGRPALGVNIITIDNAYDAMYNKLSRLGLYVTGFANSEVEASTGLQIGDCIVAVNGVEVSSKQQVLAAVFSKNVGDTVDVAVYRNNELITVQTTLIEQDESY